MEMKNPWYRKLLLGNMFQSCNRLKKHHDFHASQISLPESVLEDDFNSNQSSSSPKTRKFSTISFGYSALIDTLKRNSSVSKDFEKEVVKGMNEIESGNRKKSVSSDGDSAVSSMSDGSTEKRPKIEL